jgi:hypothetical protein
MLRFPPSATMSWWADGSAHALGDRRPPTLSRPPKEETVVSDAFNMSDKRVNIFAIPPEKGQQTLDAIVAMNSAGGGNLFTLEAESAELAGGTVSGTDCAFSTPAAVEAAGNDYICGDSDT